jgi:hypothetical protein
MFFHVLDIAIVFLYHHSEDGQSTGWNMLANMNKKYFIKLKCICWLFIRFTKAYTKFLFLIMKFAVFISTVGCVHE